MSTLNEKTLKRLRDDGWDPAMCERHLPFPKPYGRKVDLYGIIDTLAVKVGEPVFGIQTTSKANMKARITKIYASANFNTLAAAGWRIEVWGWYKKELPTKKGGTMVRWAVKIESLSPGRAAVEPQTLQGAHHGTEKITVFE